MPIKIIDRRTKDPDSSMSTRQSRPPAQPGIRTPKLTPSDRAAEARAALHGVPEQLSGEIAIRVHTVLLGYSDYFGQRYREALANSMQILAQSLKGSKQKVVESTIRKTVEDAINDPSLAIPIDEKPKIIEKIVGIAAGTKL